MKRKINIAVTISYPTLLGENIWSNGGRQNVIFLYLLLKRLPYVDNVWIVADTKRDDFLPGKLQEEITRDMVLYEDVKNDVDLLIEMGASVNPLDAERVWKRGGKVVAYKYGNDYVMSVESCSFGAHPNWVPHPSRTPVDEVWTNAQHANTCASYFKHLYKAPVEIVPHVWAPNLLEEALEANDISTKGWPYKQRHEKARVSIFEPNINIVKSSIIPFYAASQFYDNNPGLVSNIYMLNCVKLAQNPLFSRLVTSTTAGAKGVASAEKRYNFVDFIGQHCGIVLTHQWENGLNYLYYEALYGGFPLVHNSPFLKDVGYYYRDFDIDDGARALEEAWTTHDDNLEEYNAKAFELLKTVSPYSQSVIDAYDVRIQALMSS